MGFLTSHAGGPFEHMLRLVSYEGLCIMLHDDARLFQAIIDRLGEMVASYNRCLLQLDQVAAIWQGEDLGFKTQTLLPPDAIRKYVLPWHKQYAQMCHDAGRPYFLHSCGAIDEVMGDLLDNVKIDAKHSFEDTCAPIIDWKKRYGDRVALIGGVDVDVLCTAEANALRQYVRHIIGTCSCGGRFAIGTGNSVPSFAPVENYLTMVDESLRTCKLITFHSCWRGSIV